MKHSTTEDVLRRELERERAARKRDAEGAAARERRLRRLLEEQALEVEEVGEAARDALAAGVVLRHRLQSMEFGPAMVELGPVPEGVEAVVRLPPGRHPNAFGLTLRETAMRATLDAMPFDASGPTSGRWERFEPPETREVFVDASELNETIGAIAVEARRVAALDDAPPNLGPAVLAAVRQACEELRLTWSEGRAVLAPPESLLGVLDRLRAPRGSEAGAEP